jgi:GNAT superfamily N-acetyltransferase
VSFAVRPATAGDADGLAHLELEARDALIDARGGRQLLDEQPAVGDWSTVLTDGRRRVFVATIDDVLVGYLDLELGDSEQTAARVHQVYVTPEAREVGFGDDLLGAAIDEVWATGGRVIESFALPGDRDTKNLFERAGITARKLIVSKRLSGPSSSADASR